MKMFKTFVAAVLASVALAGPALAAEASVEATKQTWSFAGPFGTYDKNQLQRGFQVFREVCAGCHSANLLAFRNLEEPGGPEFTEAQVKALAASYTVNDTTAEGGKRPAVLADRWPGPDQSAADLAAAFGIVPPDFSVLAKARGLPEEGFGWVFNYFTTYNESGVDYIHALLLGYQDPAPEGVTVPDGKYYNAIFAGHAIGMPPPLTDGQVAYAAAEDGSTAPQTVDQYSKDVSAFMMWMAEPHLNATKEAGFRVLAFLILFAALLYMVKQRLWSKIH